MATKYAVTLQRVVSDQFGDDWGASPILHRDVFTLPENMSSHEFADMLERMVADLREQVEREAEVAEDALDDILPAQSHVDVMNDILAHEDMLRANKLMRERNKDGLYPTWEEPPF
jgi:hypothetical protein